MRETNKPSPAGAANPADLAAKSRRGFLTAAAETVAASAFALAAPASAAATAAPLSPPAPRCIMRPTAATSSDCVIQTSAGRVRGYVSNGIWTFKGVPYGRAPLRFMPPEAPKAWAGVRSSLSYGPVCPQPDNGRLPNDLPAFYSPGSLGFEDEDCLRVNIWTPGPRPSAPRPVIVWLHGGGFESGSSQASVAYHGENLSRRGDVVVISLNHRLNALGFLNLAAFDPKYALSANVGLLDLVLALGWIKDNAEAFGGDKGCVTLLGQSGGGRKVSALMAMPAAAGLFHRAIVHSGSLTKIGLPSETAPVAAAMMALLSVKPSDLETLQTVPVRRLVDAYKEAQRRLATPDRDIMGPPYCIPTLDGLVLRAHPFDVSAPIVSARVPLLVGSTRNEQSPSRFAPELEDSSWDQVRASVAHDYGSRADEVIDVFRRANPAGKPIDVQSRIESIPPRRLWAVQQATLKAGQRGARVFNFEFAWRTPMLDGRPRAHHGSDLPFVFYNIDRCVHATGGGAQAWSLAAKVSDAWIAFARSGDPNHPGLPTWPAVTANSLPTMILDDVCEAVQDHDREERRVATVVPDSLRHF